MGNGVRVPHESEPQSAIHTLWPSDEALWPDCLHQARIEFAQFLRRASAPDARGNQTPILIYAANEETFEDAKRQAGDFAEVIKAPYGDVWARDTGPVFVRRDDGLAAVRFQFNGWGGKYVYDGDTQIGGHIASHAGVSEMLSPIVCEGGALEFDGQGTLLTTRQCILNPNRNPSLTEAEFEAEMERLFGVRQIIWLDEGLTGDHTDGHVDNIARFIAPGHVVCQHGAGHDDPNKLVLDAIEDQLRTALDGAGRPLKVTTIPSPGAVEIGRGELGAASHMNWVIGARNLVMPVYNALGQKAAHELQGVLKSHEVVTAPSNTILTGGGSFHCVTCNQPS